MIVELRYFFREGTLLFILSLQYHKFNRVHEMKNEYE